LARTPEFEREEVLDAALQTFWRKGYEATTLPDLLDATGLARQSLYNAFGDKRALFLASLRRYVDREHGRFEQALAQGPVKAAIRGVFESVLEAASRDCGGCFLVNSAAELVPRDAEVGRLVTAAMKRQEDALSEALLRGVREGELHLPAKRILKTARFLMGTLQGLRVMARTMPQSPVPRDMVEVALRVIE